MEKKKKVSPAKKVSTPKGKTKAKKITSKDMIAFRVVAIIMVALVFTAGQQIGELVYFLIS